MKWLVALSLAIWPAGAALAAVEERAVPLEVALHRPSPAELVFQVANPGDAASPECLLALRIGQEPPRQLRVGSVPAKQIVGLRYGPERGRDLRYWPVAYQLTGQSPACQGRTKESLPEPADVRITECGPSGEDPRAVVIVWSNPAPHPGEAGRLQHSVHHQGQARGPGAKPLGQIPARTAPTRLPIRLGAELPAGMSAREVAFVVEIRGVNFPPARCRYTPR